MRIGSSFIYFIVSFSQFPDIWVIFSIQRKLSRYFLPSFRPSFLPSFFYGEYFWYRTKYSASSPSAIFPHDRSEKFCESHCVRYCFHYIMYSRVCHFHAAQHVARSSHILNIHKTLLFAFSMPRNPHRESLVIILSLIMIIRSFQKHKRIFLFSQNGLMFKKKTI